MMINAKSIPYWSTGWIDPCGWMIWKISLVSHIMHVAESITIIEYRFELLPYIKRMFRIPNRTSDKEKNTLIALTATISSVAVGSIYEYHFHTLGTEKCQIPKPIEAVLPKVTKIFAIKLKFRLQKFINQM